MCKSVLELQLKSVKFVKEKNKIWIKIAKKEKREEKNLKFFFGIIKY